MDNMKKPWVKFSFLIHGSILMESSSYYKPIFVTAELFFGKVIDINRVFSIIGD
jgi:hypothetical protein